MTTDFTLVADLRDVQAYRLVFVVLLATLTVACDDGGPTGPSPVTPTPVTPVTPAVEITITVEAPYPVGIEPEPQNPGISDVTVTCVAGCEGQQTEMTDSQGAVTFTGRTPLTVRAEKLGHIPVEQKVWGWSTVVLGHEWPLESAASFRRLQLPPNLLLNWKEDELVNVEWHGNYSCHVILVRARADRRRMVGTLEHELRHAHQDETITSGHCSDVYKEWSETEDGQAWVAATNADLAAGRLVREVDDSDYFSSRPSEREAEFYKHWIRAKWPPTGQKDICFSGESERCKYFEARHGRRPSSYP